MEAYNHMYSIAFTVISNHESGDDVTAADLRISIINRLRDLDDQELLEACGYPEDSYPVNS